MRRIAIALQAGGVGKTTVTLNLGALLAGRGRRVLLVDMDAQCNLTDGLEATYDPELTIYEALVDEKPVAKAIVPVAIRETLYLLPGSPKMARFDVAIADVDHREYRLRETLARIDGQFDYVLFDCPPGLGLVLFNTLMASDEVLVPVQTRQRRVNALPVFLKVLVRAQKFHPQLQLAGIVPNQYDARNSHDQQALAYIERFATKHGFHLFPAIRTSTRIPEAESRKLPLCDYNRSNSAADALEALAEQLDTNARALQPAAAALAAGE